ncbi:MAG TPA: hypothetical protein VMS71_07035 [Candidatus Acidoferrum sp.]|nr:hypothetical protein [Candidatus Acidoferrum sp.]
MGTIPILFFLMAATPPTIVDFPDSLEEPNATITVPLMSLEGADVNLSITLNFVVEKITARIDSTDSICIRGYKGLLRPPRILGGRFLEFLYYVRGGTGYGVQRYALLCVSEGEIYKALELRAGSQSYDGEQRFEESRDSVVYPETRIHSLVFDLEGDSGSVGLKAVDYEGYRSEKYPDRSYKIQDTVNLRFDSTKRIFYSGVDTLKGQYLIRDEVHEADETADLDGLEVPAIHFGSGDVYYYFHGVWHMIAGDGNLFRFSNSCD